MVFDRNLKSIIRNIILAVLVFLILWAVKPRLSFFEIAGVKLNTAFAEGILTIFTLIGLAFTYFALELIFLSPVRLWSEEKKRADIAEAKIIKMVEKSYPNLLIDIEGDQLVRIPLGTTSETAGGNRYTTYNTILDMACLLVTNIGESVARDCQVRLTRVWCFSFGEDQEEIRILESLPLGWDRKKIKANLSVDINPHETKRIFVGAVRPNGAMVLWQNYDEMPIEYHQLFVKPGRYRIELNISIADRAPTTVHVDVETSLNKSEPNSLGFGKATIRLSFPK